MNIGQYKLIDILVLCSKDHVIAVYDFYFENHASISV